MTDSMMAVNFSDHCLTGAEQASHVPRRHALLQHQRNAAMFQRMRSYVDMCAARADVRFGPRAEINPVLPEFEYAPRHWHAYAANLGCGHPASALIGTRHEPARSPHFDALTDRLSKA